MMMKTLSILLIFSLLSNGNLLGRVEARSLNTMSAATTDDFLPIPPIGTLKQSTLSIGEGHNFNDANTLANVKASGPSPKGGGHQGHNFNDVNTLANVKVSGPSPKGGGHQGHNFNDANTLANVKASGPSPKGGGHKGHNFNDANTFGHIKDYSPRTNVAHNFAVDADTLANVKASGPSPGGGGHHGCC
ncbi:uncharacterized protein LOC111451329 [Cucurbita moschata]|uniref:Uncharacterized protein LOC111451329 n=1 Tax=Cucurbita moschata TaxID=3662 RepID=A0A6J1G6J7_CUCMO|nr:uncharacterized protein LOC111451329 [Cucurbita moschata]